MKKKKPQKKIASKAKRPGLAKKAKKSEPKEEKEKPGSYKAAPCACRAWILETKARKLIAPDLSEHMREQCLPPPGQRDVCITHEPDASDPSRAACACGDKGYTLAEPGQSTCGQAACRDLRIHRKAQAEEVNGALCAGVPIATHPVEEVELPYGGAI